MTPRSRSAPPTFVKGRKGGVSVVDVMVRALWARPSGDGRSEWPSLSLIELQEQVSAALGYDVPSSTIRSSVYSHLEIFEKCKRVGVKVGYRLTTDARSRRP
jgi:hypothetical protein